MRGACGCAPVPVDQYPTCRHCRRCVPPGPQPQPRAPSVIAAASI